MREVKPGLLVQYLLVLWQDILKHVEDVSFQFVVMMTGLLDLAFLAVHLFVLVQSLHERQQGPKDRLQQPHIVAYFATLLRDLTHLLLNGGDYARLIQHVATQFLGLSRNICKQPYTLLEHCYVTLWLL